MVCHRHKADKTGYDGRLQILEHHIICILVSLNDLAHKRKVVLLNTVMYRSTQSLRPICADSFYSSFTHSEQEMIIIRTSKLWI